METLTNKIEEYDPFSTDVEQECLLQEHLLTYYHPEIVDCFENSLLHKEWESLINEAYASARILNQVTGDYEDIKACEEAKKLNITLGNMYALIGIVNGYRLYRRSVSLEALIMAYAEGKNRAIFKEKIEKFFAREIIEQMQKSDRIILDEMEDLKQARRLRRNLKKKMGKTTDHPGESIQNTSKNVDIPHATSKDIKISFTELVVLRNAFFCTKNHPVQPVSAVFRILSPQGFEREKTVTIGYCETCHKYILLKSDFDELRKQGVVLCQIVSGEYNQQPHYSNLGFGDMKAESILHQSGYNVNKNENLTTIQRQRILQMVLDHDLYAKIGIMSFLDWLIARAKRNMRGNMSTAIEKWTEDREFVSQYQKKHQKTVNVDRINYKY